MSPTVKTSYTRHEVRENREAFREWKWTAGTPEPDGRVTVLYNDHPGQAMRGFLCRCQHGWFWVASADELTDKAARETPYSWNMATRDLGGDAMRVPTAQELEIGGFRVTVEPEPEEGETRPVDAEVQDEADKEIDAGFHHLNRPTADTARATAHFMASIAISLYELVGLHRKYDVDNLRVEVDPGPEQGGEQTEDVKEDIDGPGSGYSPVHTAQREEHVDDTVGSTDYPYVR